MGLAGWWHNAVCPTVVGLWVGTAAGQPSRASVYRASIDAEAVARWKVPTGMTCRVHRFDGRAGGTFRISLTYHARDRAGDECAHRHLSRSFCGAGAR